MTRSRRRFLGAAAAGTASLAGCSGLTGAGDGVGGAGAAAGEESESEATPADAAVPTADADRHVPHELRTLREAVVSGGPGKDGIPSVDDPTFASAEEASLDDGEPVFGLVRNGVVRAYPQYVLVWHEVVNDLVDGEGVAVTYCPLTGTVQGFERGDVEFGVSGDLVNSNLVMYDRATDSRWPQVLATAIEGLLAGATLREFRVVWTTWGRWRDAHPDTEVLTEDTGYQRRYGSDPYGGHDPKRGYYAEDTTMFPPLAEDDRAGEKDVVVGARTDAGAVAFRKDRLLEERVLWGTVGDVAHVGVADPELATGHAYAAPGGKDVEPVEDGYRVDDEVYGPDALPLERTLAFDAMWFAWAGFYPGTDYVE